MSELPPDVAPPIRRALISDVAFAGSLSTWHHEPAVFIRRPAPADAGMPLVLINPPAAITNQDTLTGDRPVIVRDVMIYGLRAEPGDPRDQSKLVEALGYRARAIFHRQKFSISVPGFSVIDIVGNGPIPAPVDDVATVGRMVSLTIRLRRSET